MQETRS
jgi:hypothetical protein